MSNHTNHTQFSKSVELLAQAKEIFGSELVQEAYVQNRATQMTHDGTIPNMVLPMPIDLNTKNKIEYDNMTILLKFSNGKAVSFTNSEWAFIASEDLSEIEIIEHTFA